MKLFSFAVTMILVVSFVAFAAPRPAGAMKKVAAPLAKAVLCGISMEVGHSALENTFNKEDKPLFQPVPFPDIEDNTILWVMGGLLLLFLFLGSIGVCLCCGCGVAGVLIFKKKQEVME